MEEKLASEEVPARRREKRNEPYERKPPEPVEVNDRMDDVGTDTFLDVAGPPLRMLRYFPSVVTGPSSPCTDRP